jgi:hypothetical protein
MKESISLHVDPLLRASEQYFPKSDTGGEVKEHT